MKKLIKIICLLGLYALVALGISSFIGGEFDTPVVYKSYTTGKIEGVMTKDSYPDVITGLEESELPKKYELIWTK